MNSNQPVTFNIRTLAYLALNAFGIFLIYLMHEFITPFLGSVIFFVLFRPFMEKMVNKWKWKEGWSAILIIIISFIIVLIPIMVFCYMVYGRITDIISNPDSIMNGVKQLDAKFMELTGRQLLSPDLTTKMQEQAGQMIPSFLGKIFVVAGNIAIMYFVLYYMLTQRKKMIGEVHNYLPFTAENRKILGDELESQTLSNSIGVPLIAVIQGATAGLGYWMFGVQEPVFWAVVTAFASILPLVGSTLIWAPAGLILIALGDTWMGVGLLIYGGVVVINIDNVARLILQKRFADVHPIITVFGVIVGLDLFGLPGLIFGPLMLSYFVIFIRMYRKIYHVDATAAGSSITEKRHDD
ncbi:MAG: AI-2E family transporter [Bacteroidota bacterium]